MSYLGPTLRRKRRPARRWPRIGAALLVSLAVNAALVKLLRLDAIVPDGTVKVSRPVALAPLSAEQWAANRAVRGAAPPPTEGKPIVPPKVVKPPEPDMKGQVVALGPGKNDEKPPDNTNLLAERNSRVEKQTLSRDRRAGYENAAPRPSSQTSGQPQPEHTTQAKPEQQQHRAAQGLASGKGAENRRGKPGEDGTELPDQRGRQKLALKLDTFGETMPTEGRQEIKGNSGKVAMGNPLAPDQQGEGTALGAGRGKIDVSQLKPSAAFYDRLAGGPSPDHVEGVVEGDETMLNAREFKYASYLNRVKEGIATHWDPARAMSARDPDGSRFPPSDRITVVVFSLDERGAVRNVEVVGRSGLDFIDRAAVSAIQEAQPFINPPHQMFAGRDEIPLRFVFRFTMADIGALRRLGRNVP